MKRDFLFSLWTWLDLPIFLVSPFYPCEIMYDSFLRVALSLCCVANHSSLCIIVYPICIMNANPWIWCILVEHVCHHVFCIFCQISPMIKTYMCGILIIFLLTLAMCEGYKQKKSVFVCCSGLDVSYSCV